MDEQNHENQYSSIINRIRKGKMESENIFRNSFGKYYINGDKFKEKNEYLGGIPTGYNQSDDSVSVDSSDVHSLIIGSTGSKKSRLIIMPSVKILASAGESMIISDPKAEIYDRTASELYKKGYNIYVINLRNPQLGESWNPLAIPYQLYLKGDIDKAYEFVNDISINLMLAEVSEKDPYWDHSARDLFFGLTLALFKYCKEYEKTNETVNIRNLIYLRNFMFSGYNDHVDDKFTAYIKTDEIIYSSLIGTIFAPEKTQACILSTFDEKIRPFMIQPNLLNMLSYNDVWLDDIGTKKSAIYLIMPDEKTSYHKLITLFIKQSYEYLIFKAQLQQESKMHIRVNYILDEFSSLPTMRDFPAMITAARSRNIRFNLVIQSKNQLVMRYHEEAETIFTNCTNWIFLTSRELSLLEDISKLCGVVYNTGRPIIPAASLQYLDKKRGEALIMSGRLHPFISTLKDISYYDKDKVSNLPMKERKRPFPGLISFDFVKNNRIFYNNKSIDMLERTDDQEAVDNIAKEAKMNDLQRELEKKFDNLFGDSE